MTLRIIGADPQSHWGWPSESLGLTLRVIEVDPQNHWDWPSESLRMTLRIIGADAQSHWGWPSESLRLTLRIIGAACGRRTSSSIVWLMSLWCCSTNCAGYHSHMYFANLSSSLHNLQVASFETPTDCCQCRRAEWWPLWKRAKSSLKRTFWSAHREKMCAPSATHVGW